MTRPHRRYYESERRGFEFQGWISDPLRAAKCRGWKCALWPCVRREGGAISRKFSRGSSSFFDSSFKRRGETGFAVRFISFDLNFVRFGDRFPRISPVAALDFEYLSSRRWKSKMKIHIKLRIWDMEQVLVALKLYTFKLYGIFRHPRSIYLWLRAASRELEYEFNIRKRDVA